jgi:integrase
MKRKYRSTFYYMGKRYERTSLISQRDADKKADALKKEFENGNIGISNRMFVSDWSYEWLETYKKPRVGLKCYKEHKRHIDNLIIPQIGGMRLNDVTDIHLQRILNCKAGYSFSDAKYLRDTIKAIFRKARESRLLTYDPSEYLLMPNVTKGTHRSISKLEREHFLLAAETHQSGLMFKTMLYCGLRPGEVAALSWKDIDFENHMINVVAAMEAGRQVMKSTKTAAGVRRIPIPDELYVEFDILKGESESPVFIQPKAGFRHTDTSRKIAWRSLVKAIDDSMGAKWEKVKAKDGKMRWKKVQSVVADDFVPYCLRHTYCTDLQAKGVPLKVASYLMGHASIAVTANIYTHITEDMLEDTAKLESE